MATDRVKIAVFIPFCAFFALVGLIKMALCFLTNNYAAAERVALQFDDTFNVALSGQADQKFSTRCYVQSSLGSRKYTIIMRILDKAFNWLTGEINHCKNSYLSEL